MKNEEIYSPQHLCTTRCAQFWSMTWTLLILLSSLYVCTSLTTGGSSSPLTCTWNQSTGPTPGPWTRWNDIITMSSPTNCSQCLPRLGHWLQERARPFSALSSERRSSYIHTIQTFEGKQFCEICQQGQLCSGSNNNARVFTVIFSDNHSRQRFHPQTFPTIMV